MNYNRTYIRVLTCTALAGCGDAQQDKGNESEARAGSAERTRMAMSIFAGPDSEDYEQGLWAKAVSGDHADVHTTLWLYDENAEGGRGTEIWTSGGSQPFQFTLDRGQVIKGWDLGVACMLKARRVN